MLDNVIGNYLQDLATKPVNLSFSFDKMPMLDSMNILNSEREKTIEAKSGDNDSA